LPTVLLEVSNTSHAGDLPESPSWIKADDDTESAARPLDLCGTASLWFDIWNALLGFPGSFDIFAAGHQADEGGHCPD